MNNLINLAIRQIFSQLEIGNKFTTPDNNKGAQFIIGEISENKLTIKTDKGSKINISAEAFTESLVYLFNNKHDKNNPILIKTRSDINNAGPLCLTARNANTNGDQRCIGYILPILHQFGIVGIEGNTPNKCWHL